MSTQRHVTADGFVVVRAPSMLGPMFQRGDEWVFNYWILGVKHEFKSNHQYHTVYEWDRMLNFQTYAETRPYD